MIVGNGNIASVLPKRDDLLFFASGVSNSQETRESEYQREISLLMQQPKDKHIVYFSSLAVFKSEKKYTRYIRHKREMEKTIKAYFEPYTIIRIGNIGWKNDNPNTIINFLKNKIKNNEEFEIQNVYRYIINKEDFLHYINLIPDWNCEMTLFGRKMTVQEIVNEIKEGKL